MNNVRRTIPYIPFAAGFALGCIVTNNVLRHAELTADQALQIAKETLQKAGPIHSSWIFMKKERLIKNGLTYYTYRGGISRLENGEQKQYTYYIDSKSGAIMDVDPPLPKESQPSS